MIRNSCFRSVISHYQFLSRQGMELGVCFGSALPVEPVLDGHRRLVRGEMPYLKDEEPASMFTPAYPFSQFTHMKADE